MADNVQISDNPIIAADVIGGITYQRIKPSVGADGVAVDVSDSNPMPVSEVNSAGIASASAYLQSTISTLGSTPTIATSLRDLNGDQLTFATPLDALCSTLTIDVSQYVANDNLHAAFTFDNVTSVPGGSGWITELRLYDLDSVGSNFEVWFFNAALASAPAKNAAFSLTDADIAKTVAVISTANGVWYDGMNDNKICIVPVSPPLPYKLASGTSLIALAKILSTSTYTGSSDISFRIHVLRD